MSDYELWRVFVALTSPPDDPNPVYTEITQYVDTITQNISVSLGDTEETEDDPSGATLVINNSSQQFTLGNPLATMPLDAGMRVLALETHGYRTYKHISGYLRWPEVPSWAGGSTTSPRDQTITIQVVDLISWLDGGEPFESMLAEHIKHVGGSSLRYFWSLTDAGLAFANTVGAPATLTPVSGTVGVLPTESSVSGQYLSPQGGTAILADDATPLMFATDLNASLFAPGVGVTRWRQITTSINMPVNNDMVTLAFWVWPDNSRGDGAAAGVVANLFANFEVDARMMFVSNLGDGVNWSAIFTAGASSVTLTTPRPRMQAWNLVALSMDLSSTQCTAYVHNLGTVTGPLVGSVTITQVFDTVYYGGRFNGSVGYGQIYVGAGAYSQAIHNAQIDMARYGLEGQLTGARVNTIADYVGVPAAARRIDRGVASMSRVTLAGRTAPAVWAEAADTEQGRFYADGDGALVFADRIRRYVP